MVGEINYALSWRWRKKVWCYKKCVLDFKNYSSTNNFGTTRQCFSTFVIAEQLIDNPSYSLRTNRHQVHKLLAPLKLFLGKNCHKRKSIRKLFVQPQKHVGLKVISRPTTKRHRVTLSTYLWCQNRRCMKKQWVCVLEKRKRVREKMCAFKVCVWVYQEKEKERR